MNRLLTALLASVAGATIAAAPAAAQSDASASAYRAAMEKIEKQHDTTKDKCDALSKEDVCEEQADVARARAELAAAQKYANTDANLDAARRKLADAEYELAEEKCDAMQGKQQESCMSTAKSARTAALDNTRAKAGATGGNGATAAIAGAAGSAGLVASTDTRDPVKAKAVEKCERRGNETACLVENKGQPDTVLERAGEKTRNALATVVDKTKEAGRNVADKSRELTAGATGAAAGAAARTERAAENAGDKTRDTASTAAERTEQAGERTGSRIATNLSDAAITAKVKTGLAAAEDTSALEVNVETEKGVVMLSGFVDSKAEAERAEKVAKGIEGVTKVRSAIKVK